MRGLALLGMLAWHAQEREQLTPDGVHPNMAGARRLWAEVLGPAVRAGAG